MMLRCHGSVQSYYSGATRTGSQPPVKPAEQRPAIDPITWGAMHASTVFAPRVADAVGPPSLPHSDLLQNPANSWPQLKCNVQQDPFVACSRCSKQKLNCVIEPNFKRVGKRTRNAEMEREMERLRERLAMFEGRGIPQNQPPIVNAPQPMPENRAFASGPAHTEEDDAFLQSQTQQVAATSLLDLRSGSPMFHTLESIKLSPPQVTDLFQLFFDLYHPFLPFLDPTRSPDEVFSKDHKLLFWAIISVAARHYDTDPGLLKRLKEPLTNLRNQTVMGQTNHHVVKALCLLCYWPLPTNRTVLDPTWRLCGLMMQIAMEIGLHQPTHPQDFSRTKVRLREEDIHDRLRTWAVCNIVAQTVCTGYGQPSITLYDSTLDFRTDDEDHMRIIPPDLFVRLRQEMAASRINKLLYSMSSHRFSEGAATAYMHLEADRLKEERGLLDGVNKGMSDLLLTSIHANPMRRIGRATSLRSVSASAPLLLLQQGSPTRAPRRFGCSIFSSHRFLGPCIQSAAREQADICPIPHHANGSCVRIRLAQASQFRPPRRPTYRSGPPVRLADSRSVTEVQSRDE